jgi:hypothetical protein
VLGVMIRKSTISGTDFLTYRFAFNSRIRQSKKIVFAEIAKNVLASYGEGLLICSQGTVARFSLCVR